MSADEQVGQESDPKLTLPKFVPEDLEQRKAKLNASKVKRFTPAEQAEVMTLWKTGNYTMDELCKKFNRHPVTLARLFAKHGVKKGQLNEAIMEAAEEAQKQKAAETALQNVERAMETRDETYRMAQGLQKLGWFLLMKMQKENKSIAGLEKEVKVIKEMMGVIEIGQRARFAALGINKDGGSPDEETPPESLTIRVLNRAEIEQMRKKNFVADEDEEDIGDFDLGKDGEDLGEVPELGQE